MDKKSLNVPHIASLDDMHIENVAAILEEQGARRTIDSLNWSEHPYHPLTTFSIAHSGTHIYIDFFVILTLSRDGIGLRERCASDT